eukprot:6188461-Pleurochrysis_carterae.AAC.1
MVCTGPEMSLSVRWPSSVRSSSSSIEWSTMSVNEKKLRIVSRCSRGMSCLTARQMHKFKRSICMFQPTFEWANFSERMQ